MEFARSGQADIAYEVVGGGASELLLIHAGVSDRRSWRPLIAHLGDSYRCVAFDMRGFGETQYEPEPGWSLTADALAVIDAAGLTAPVLIASSLGGLVALDLALAAPERVGGLVLIGPAVRGAPAPDVDPDGPTARLSEAIEAADEAGDLDEVVRLETHLWLDGPSAPEGRVSGPVRELFMEMDRASELADDPGEMAEVSDAWPRLGQITVPTLVLTGRLDAEHLQTLNPELAQRLPRGRHEWLDGVAHLPHVEGDPATLAAISSFLEEIRAVSAAPQSPSRLARLDWPRQTERLTLRPGRVDDAAAIFAYRRLEEVGRWLTNVETDRGVWEQRWAKRLLTTIVVERGGEVIGDTRIVVADAHASGEVQDQAAGVEAELMWAFHPDGQGQGYATEAVLALIEICFGELGLRRVEAHCFADNPASWTLMERVGMRREAHFVAATLHRDGTWRDFLSYGLLAPGA